MELQVLNQNGSGENTVPLSEAVFQQDFNEDLVHQLVNTYIHNSHQRTKGQKNRSAVRGGGKKPWKQKGTGRARQGSLRAPAFIGGGIAHGPGGRVYIDRTPKKMKKKSLNMAISQRIKEESLFIVDGEATEAPSTKLASSILNDFNIEKSFIFVYGENDDNLIKSFRNLKHSRIVSVKKLSTYDVISTDNTVLSKNAMEYLTGDSK